MVAKKAMHIKKPASRARQSFARRDLYKEQRDRILIVCEDSVTAPEYFKAMCKDLGLGCSPDSLANVCVHGKECAPDPASLLLHIKTEIGKQDDNPYDRAYWVSDKDGHTGFLPTLELIGQNPVHNKTSIIPAYSIPCFEFWLLLHFSPSTRPFNKCDEVGAVIKKDHDRAYKKGEDGLYAKYKDRTPAAIANAKIVLKDKTTKGNPSTHIHILVEDLMKQAKK